MSRRDRLNWRARGSPFRLMRPAADLRDALRAHGYTVYDLGDTRHLEHEPPEDHTPYSMTGYPGKAQYGVGYAVDIMPPKVGQKSPKDGLPLPSLQQLGTQLLADRKAGVPGIRWLKYMNWEPERNNGGLCWHESWQPNYRRTPSGDRGHIHLSGLTGYEDSSIGAGYDPVARIRGRNDDVTPQEIDAIANRVAEKVWVRPIGPKTDVAGRTHDSWAADAMNGRNYLYAPPGKTGLINPPPPGSTLDLLAKMVASWPTLLATVASIHTAVEGDDVDAAALAAALAPLLLDKLTVDQLADSIAARPQFAQALVTAIGAKLSTPDAG